MCWNSQTQERARLGPACLGLAVTLVFNVACPGPAPEQPKKVDRSELPSRNPVPKKKEDPPGVKDDGTIISAVDWYHGSLSEALEEAGKDNKLVLADVGAYWCPPCHELDEKTFVDEDVGTFVEQDLIPIHIDAEKGEGPEIVDRYHIQAYPTILVLEPSGVEKGRIVDFIAPKEFIEAVKTIGAGENVLGRLEKEVETAPDDMEKKYALAHAYALAAKREEAESLFDEILTADPNDEMGLASKVFYDRAMFFVAKLEGDHEGAVAAFRKLQETYPKSKSAIRAYRQIGRNLHELGRDDEAIEALEAMIATDPSDAGLKSSYGWFSFRQKCRPESGLAAVDAGIEQDPEAAGLRYVRAELLHQLGRHDEALASIEEAAKLEPKSAYYRRQVARFQALTGGESEVPARRND